jgi:hypothetical protein
MSELKLTPEDLLAGSGLTFDVIVPPGILHPGKDSNGEEENDQAGKMFVQLRPLTIGTFQLIMKAARNDMGLIPLLMIKESLVEPKLALEQIKQLHLGLIDFLIRHIRQISGLREKKSP